ncbi:hypothetical protein [Jidongwangia harbinensis]|uniref:hypothetical protein n=1 Tax=Jidongwangia harbinensis TaxID=2878561 RepID=UPI001CDA0E6A|nr:hypothetical protein [Jidongwangia harbinensis]MCA2218802.1 hypothetical protein [Jidongwangia harbinensis]
MAATGSVPAGPAGVASSLCVRRGRDSNSSVNDGRAACAARPSGDVSPGRGPRPWRAASISPDDSARPAANSTSAAARPDEQGSGSPQTGHSIMPSRGPAPPACASSISRAVRASRLSGLTYV